ncbi:protocadherin Fat 4-like [Myxocyprinus asiaticus]|uniref:protocadherin Fat 4-like n=1 Tax=Myxocyprinus asiaticus TaxID=70543 RepID=UPI0022232504|nr:protocadherin Fat 4-like [Myxocyprinus asiaticus]
MEGIIKSHQWRYVSMLLIFSAVLYSASAVTHYSIPEEMEEGSVVANLASDLGLDVKTLSRRKMRLDIISNKKYLDVNKETGELYILEKMDREYLCSVKTATTCFIKMEVTLENPVRIFNIEIEIVDINDNAPQFRRDTIHLDISESTAAGERFSLSNAVDPDIGSNSIKTYYLSESAHFDIEIQTGRDGSKFADLILKKPLDREEHASHNLILTAVDGGVPARSGTASIIVRVLDTNDNAPQFDKDSYTINLTENSPIGSLVVKLNATDKDEGSNSDIMYSYSLYTSEKTQQTFSLNPDNGEIRVKEMINYEDFRIYDMEIIATDKGANSLSGKCKVKILITDMNDNHPEISIKSFSSPVKEDIPVNTVIAVVSVSDKDSGENGQVDVHISDDLPFALQESSNNYYELIVSEPLDREKVPEYDITITVIDRGNPPLSDNETITLELLDVNDNVPQFPQTFYTIPVMENNAPGALLSSLTAIDPDLHENQYLVYFIIEKEIVNTSMSMLFSMNPENGNLYALKTFDYEIEKEFLFHIEARDSGVPPLSSNVTVHIIIMDQNDNTPLIVSPWRAHGSVVEEKIPRSTDKGTLISKVIAIDSDSVHNSRITYQFLQNTDATLFSLDQYNGEIRTMRMFSYRDSRHQRLVVIAKDNGEPALSATVTIKLSTVETALKAYADMTEVPLEYDIFSDLNLYLVIGLGSVSFLLLITILVTIVLKCQKAKPSKAAPPCRNSVISERNSTIADSTLVSNDAYWYSLFLAETRKGKLVVRQPVPKGARYIVSSIPRSTGLTETSDSAASTLQEMDEGSVVSNLATDLGLDVRTLSRRKIRLDTLANKKYLDINKETGELFIVERIDREHICTTKSAATCVLKLDATIENPVRMFNIELEILDINDNAPNFRRDTMHLDISESTPVGERFSLNNAIDPDIGVNSIKTYYLSESDYFSVEIQTGRDGSKFTDLILKKALDREEQAIHNLVLTAVDGGVPARSGTASIIVRVLDTNDNAPQFDKDSYTINLTENSPIGSLVVKLNATDKDEGSNSDIMYSYSLYTSEKTQQTFSLNPDNGEIRVKEMINYEDFRIYDMEIIATDKGANSLSGKCKVKILITDMNDNHPEISIKSFSSPVKEDIPVNTVIAVVSVSDKDSGENGQVDVHISDDLPFALQESSDNYYELIVSEPLDREKVPEYDITITVIDRGNPPLSDNETITLELLDVNDNVPQFPQTFYTIPVMENNAPGALLSSLTAIDPDLHENQYLVYFIIEKEIVNTSMSMLFSMNPENGNLYALKTFDYEIEKEFLFHIEARDSGVPPLSSNVTVHIIIMDQNDNTPLIVSPWRAHGSVVEEKIPRSTDKGTLIAKVIAIDSDSVHNSRITYQFLQNTDATLFSLDQYNGEIRTMRMFSYRDSRHQRLVVIAKDNGEPALSATVTIKLSTVETALKAYADMTEVPLEYDIFSDLNLYLVIGLGSVSFLLLITIFVTIVLKCQKAKPSKAAPPCRNSVISERNSTIADSTLVSNDAYWYSLFLAETRKGKLVVRQPVPKGARYIVSSIPRSTGLTETSDSAASTLQASLAVTHYTIPEEMDEGSVVANLASDLGLDLKTLSKRKMRLDVVANKRYLDVNKDTGELYILERIDRENICPSKSVTTCVIKVDATLENPIRLFNIELEIMDINDNAPRFRRDTMYLDISESTATGERFSLTNAVDPDTGSNSIKTYYLSESDHFSIEIQTGRDGSKFADLILKKPLDREEHASHNLILTAVDGGVPARSGTVGVIVRVLDTNDNAPQFDKDSYTINLTENSPIGSLVLKLNASDIDDGTNSDVVYSFSLYTSEKTQQTFSLNPDSGEIRVKEMINYEDFRIYDMEIIATDKGANSLSGKCKVKILITDMNDNHPEISIKSFSSPVKEDIPVNTVIAVVSVSDKDSGENGQVDVHISDDLPFALQESSDNYYELIVSEPLDREKVPEYDITITVIDRGNPPLSDNETITLELLDVNDNVPQFPQTFYTIPVMENNAPGALLSSLTAIDPDLHENQYLVYFIIEKEIVNTSMSMLFSMNPENGNLYALKTFDYEIEKEFLFHIEARDSGVPPLSSNVTVHIIIMDQNDNTPLIVSPWRAHGSVVEEKIPRSTDKGTLISKVIAIDSDSVHNSRITYQFLQNTDATLFSLDQYNGEIRTMRMFSYRDSRHQRLVVIAKDNGEPALSATVTIKLSTVETALKAYADMTEVPLEYDIFSDLNLYLVIGLGSVSFLLLITILVTIVLKCQKAKPSKAAPPCRNSVISERNSTIADSTLVSNDAYWYSLFLAETRKGKLVVRQPVPKGARYIVSSIPRSTGLTETSDSAASTLQGEIHRVQYTEKHRTDRDQRLRCIYATTYKDTRLTERMEAQPRMEYIATFLLLSAVVNIASSVTHYSIPEEMEVGSVVANLAADLGIDVQTLGSRKIRLDILANKKYLDVNKDTGELLILERIDREYICTSKTVCYLKMEVILENPVRIFNIELEIMDINDNAPYFRRDTINLDVSESTSVGERFSLSNAVDPDIGSNSIKSYHLSESANFDIQVQTGRDGSKFADLILKKSLDREEQAIHNLILTAVDGGVPARSGTASIIVRVLDTNDNAPQFDKDSYTINLTENSPIGSLVVKLNATDKDEGSNAAITYSFSLYTSEKTQKTFELNPNSGEIRVKEMINYEDFRIYDMEIIATDKGANSLSGKCKVKILITDMNDNHPEISIKSFSSPVKEDIPVNTVIAVVSVSDKDSGENGQVDVHISDDLPFALKESSDNYYELIVSEPLDREKVPEYDITITVIDRGNPPLSDNETITLELLDVNDNVPQFPQTFYTIPVMENNAPGALLSSLTAIDPDLHENQYLVYFIIEKEIVNTSMSMLFSMNPENGNLYALKTFDYEIEKEFLFHIEARDSGVPPLSSNVTVHIIIMDQNDNTPLIVSPWRAHGSVVEEKIPRSTDKGTLISKVIAIDSDSVHNSRITYQFLQNTDATLFSLDQYNGEIRTMRMFSYRDSRHQRLVVIAKDNGEPVLSATVTIKLSTVETALKAYADMTEVPLEYDIFSDLNLYLVIGLGSVSFLLLITILVTIVLKCQKAKPSKAAPPCRNSVISERNSTIADSTLVSNDAYWYSLFLAETRKGKLVVRQPVPKGARYIVSSIPRSTGLTETSDSAASTLQASTTTSSSST